MYDWRNEPMPQHERWKTKTGRFVYWANRSRTHDGVSPVSLAIGVIIGWLAHFVTSQRFSVYTGIAVVFICDMALSRALRYYGFRTDKQKSTLFQKLLSFIFLAAAGLLILDALKQWHILG